jgi:hypothetical protein
MKWLAIISIGSLLGCAAVDVARAADAYEVVTVPNANAQNTIGIFRINVATGQVVNSWGTATNFVVIVDDATLPAGEYHLRVTEALDRSGTWNMDRYDAKSGRLWYLIGGANASFIWKEITEPAPTTAPK